MDKTRCWPFSGWFPNLKANRLDGGAQLSVSNFGKVFRLIPRLHIPLDHSSLNPPEARGCWYQDGGWGLEPLVVGFMHHSATWYKDFTVGTMKLFSSWLAWSMKMCSMLPWKVELLCLDACFANQSRNGTVFHYFHALLQWNVSRNCCVRLISMA